MALTACGGDAEVAQPTPLPTASPTPTPVINQAADQALADSLLVTTSDLPSGWRVGTVSATGRVRADALAPELENCLGLQALHAQVSAEASGLYLASGDSQVSSAVTVMRNRDVARQIVDTARSNGGPCYESFVNRLVRQAFEAELVQVEVDTSYAEVPVDNLGSDVTARLGIVFLGKGSRTAAVLPDPFPQTAKVTHDAEGSSGFIDLVLMQKGRAVVLILFGDANTGFDVGVERNVLGRVGSRLRSA